MALETCSWVEIGEGLSGACGRHRNWGIRLAMNTGREALLGHLVAACREHYGGRLVSLAVFGSVGRGTARPDSDVDLFIVADDLPVGRVPRMSEFSGAEKLLAARLAGNDLGGPEPFLSPVIKTPVEVGRGSLLFLDMIEVARILHDRDGFLRQALDELKARLERLGARRIWRGNAWFWDLKPDYRPGEVFEL